jgi:hypothetical protein
MMFGTTTTTNALAFRHSSSNQSFEADGSAAAQLKR